MAGSATNLPDGSVRVVLDTDDPAAVTDYISALTANRFRFIFFGRIRDVERSLWQGRVDGDYVF
jgi:acylphosphatase